jgi:hypothetical protein
LGFPLNVRCRAGKDVVIKHFRDDKREELDREVANLKRVAELGDLVPRVLSRSKLPQVLLLQPIGQPFAETSFAIEVRARISLVIVVVST